MFIFLAHLRGSSLFKNCDMVLRMCRQGNMWNISFSSDLMIKSIDWRLLKCTYMNP